ncbi:MAG: hypothetical protein ACRDH5_05240, partial [bacterium]
QAPSAHSLHAPEGPSRGVAPEVASAVVHQRFEESLSTGDAFLARAREVAGIVPGPLLEEFAPYLPAYRAIAARGGGVRFVALGALGADTLAALRNAGVQVRVLEEAREFAFVASDDDVLLFPAHLPPESGLRPVTVLLSDLLLVAHARLRFEDAWERAAEPVRA